MSKKNTFVLSDSSKINSNGFRIDLSGLNTERFLTNPVMLYRHNSDDVIGRWENLRVEDGRLLAEPVYDEDDELATKVKGKVERGFLKGCSVGIYIKEMIHADNDVMTATKAELLEASICAIPSDAGAVVLYDKDRNKLTLEDVKLQFKLNNINKTQENMDEKEKTELEQTLTAKDQEIAALKAEIAESKKQAMQSYLDAAVQAGKINENEKASFEKLAAVDFDTVKTLLDSKEPKPSGSLKTLQQQAQKQAPEGRESWTYLEWMKQDSEGLKRLKAENPKEFERLQATLNK